MITALPMTVPPIPPFRWLTLQVGPAAEGPVPWQDDLNRYRPHAARAVPRDWSQFYRRRPSRRLRHPDYWAYAANEVSKPVSQR